MEKNSPLLQATRRFLERPIYLTIGINITIASVLVLAYSTWLTLVTVVVGGAMIWFGRHAGKANSLVVSEIPRETNQRRRMQMIL